MMLLQQIYQTLFAHKLRAALAVIAVSWGILAVLVLVALGEGFYQVNVKSFAVLMSDTQLAMNGQTTQPWQGLPAGRSITFREETARKLVEHKEVDAVSVLYFKWDASVTDVTGRTIPGYVRGADQYYTELRNVRLQPGSRGINPSDMANHSRVAVIGWQLAKQANLQVGGELKINGVPFTVVGLTQQAEGGSAFGRREDNQVIIPSKTYLDLWYAKPSQLWVKPHQGVSGALLRKSLQHYFAKIEHFNPADPNAIWLPNFGEDAKFFDALLRGIQSFLGASGVMTLAVGALGVANIMFLSVTERTREIGVRLAIGARQRDILNHFIAEGCLLVGLGCLVGVLLAYGAVEGLLAIGLPGWLGKPEITTWSLWLTVGVTIILALLAAWFPARRAARLTPVIALSARG
ncbi:ABC transporter permease [Photobacterium kagoshimensis]|uniref:ABC transporter permease n=1 Tax=Photobacterium kagoshimensis TaxID=2910242 RepID=UPI003D13D590